MKLVLVRLLPWYCTAALALAFLTVPAAAQLDLTPGQEADALEEDLGYGYNTRDGSAALELQNSATFCADAATVVVDPTDADAVREILGASDLGNGTWEVPAPDNGDVIVAKVQNATAFYSADVDETGSGALAASLPVISSASISIVRPIWQRCWRVRRYHQCGTLGACPGGCFFGFHFTLIRNHLDCRFTGNPADHCLEFLYPVCRLNKNLCRDCSGPIVASWPWNKWVCAVF